MICHPKAFSVLYELLSEFAPPNHYGLSRYHNGAACTLIGGNVIEDTEDEADQSRNQNGDQALVGQCPHWQLGVLALNFMKPISMQISTNTQKLLTPLVNRFDEGIRVRGLQ